MTTRWGLQRKDSNHKKPKRVNQIANHILLVYFPILFDLNLDFTIQYNAMFTHLISHHLYSFTLSPHPSAAAAAAVLFPYELVQQRNHVAQIPIAQQHHVKPLAVLLQPLFHPVLKGREG